MEAPSRRPIRWPDDAEILLRIYGSTRVEELAAVPWSEAQKATFIEQQFQAQHAHYTKHFPQAAFELIEGPEAPIGRLYVDRRADEIRVIDIALLPEHRGRGLGGRLMGEVLEEAAARGVPVRIHVERNNPAWRLYARLGFVEVGDAGIYALLECQAKIAS